MEFRRRIEPALTRWLQDQGGEPADLTGDSELTAMLLASENAAYRAAPGAAAPVPEEVMRAWHRQLARSRRVLAQSEHGFITQARRQGWSDERISGVLGLDDGVGVEEYADDLAERIVRMHPGNQVRPWTG